MIVAIIVLSIVLLISVILNVLFGCAVGVYAKDWADSKRTIKYYKELSKERKEKIENLSKELARENFDE